MNVSGFRRHLERFLEGKRTEIGKKAESQGFEPREAFTSTVFKTVAIDRSANSPAQM